MGEDFVPGSGGVASQVQAFVVPAASQSARSNGAPTVVVVGNESQKPGPPVPPGVQKSRPGLRGARSLSLRNSGFSRKPAGVATCPKNLRFNQKLTIGHDLLVISPDVELTAYDVDVRR